MGAILRHGSMEQSIYKNSPLRHPGNIQLHYQYPFWQSESFSHFHAPGFPHAPPPSAGVSFLSHSYPPYSPQPPLLPLPPPANSRRRNSIRGQSCPPSNKKANNGGRNKISSKKSISPIKNHKTEENNSPDQKLPGKFATVSSVKELPNVLPLNSSPGNCIAAKRLSFQYENGKDQIFDSMFSGSVAFTISPPPSSLPLPTFSLRPKLGCNAEAAGVDAGATDNLRRLLRLR